MLMNLIKNFAYRGYKKIIRMQNKNKLKKSEEAIKQFHNKYKGKTCFIIGNGPSLLVDDLERLKKHNAICFGTHRIYQIFDKTNWRPTFYCAQDFKTVNEEYKKISSLDVNPKFIAIIPDQKYKRLTDAIYVKIITNPFFPELPEFSDDISKGEFEGFTVTYMCLQLAMYMGFSQIYLLGVDHTYSTELNPDGTVRHSEMVKDYFSESYKLDNIPQTYKSTLAYYAARKYADEHGVHIYNATRGGKLDAFERVDFDEIL